MAGFHRTEIKKGVYGEVSKVLEEWEEALDSLEQGQYLMLLIELSDMIGALAGVACGYGVSLDDIRAHMSNPGPDGLLTGLPIADHLHSVFVLVHLLEKEVDRGEDGSAVVDLIESVSKTISGLTPKVIGESQSPGLLTMFAELRSRVAREEMDP